MKKDSRSAALMALERCRKSGAWSGAAIDAAIRECGLDGRDSALASRLFLGVLQNGSFLDHYIDLFCSGSPEPRLRQILRLGAFQLLFLNKIPAHAAVSETVGLCREAGLSRAAGLCNAVLRRIAENKDALPPIPGEGSAEYLAIRRSHPLWLTERLCREQGYASAEAFLRENNEPAPLTIQVNRLRIEPEDYEHALQRSGVPFRAFPELPGCLELEGGRVTELPGYEEGLFYVQDRAARIAAEAAGVKPGMRVLDACAAPGGKSFATAIAAEGRGDITACDIHEKKLRLIREGAERLGIGCIRTEARDARRFDPDYEGAFDAVLADVPCSGLGVIRKRPEIRWKTEEEIRELPEIQAAILDNLARYVKPGGVLLYSTCTVLQAENREQILRFLARHSDYRSEDFAVGGLRSEEGCYEFWPQTDGTDGFFAAKLRRK
jgi:16S rRNA (cytosine967-C5)-methyltransferase